MQKKLGRNPEKLRIDDGKQETLSSVCFPFGLLGLFFCLFFLHRGKKVHLYGSLNKFHPVGFVILFYFSLPARITTVLLM